MSVPSSKYRFETDEIFETKTSFSGAFIVAFAPQQGFYVFYIFQAMLELWYSTFYNGKRLSVSLVNLSFIFDLMGSSLTEQNVGFVCLAPCYIKKLAALTLKTHQHIFCVNYARLSLSTVMYVKVKSFEIFVSRCHFPNTLTETHFYTESDQK